MRCFDARLGSVFELDNLRSRLTVLVLGDEPVFEHLGEHKILATLELVAV